MTKNNTEIIKWFMENAEFGFSDDDPECVILYIADMAEYLADNDIYAHMEAILGKAKGVSHLEWADKEFMTFHCDTKSLVDIRKRMIQTLSEYLGIA